MFNPADVLPSSVRSFIWVPILLALVFVATRYFTRRTRPMPERALGLPQDITLTHRPILTAAVTKFFRTLQPAVGTQYIIFPQLPLWTLVQSESNNNQSAIALTNRINLKRVDFVLVNSASLKVSMTIELDDRTHRRTDRRQRVSRLVRTTLSITKKLRHHMGAIKYFLCDSTLTTCAA